MLSGNLSNAVIETMSPSTNDGTIRFVERRKQVKNDTKKRFPLTFNIGVTSWYSKYFLRSSLSYHCVSICPVSSYPITVAYHRRTSSLRIVVYCVYCVSFPWCDDKKPTMSFRTHCVCVSCIIRKRIKRIVSLLHINADGQALHCFFLFFFLLLG